MQFRLCGANVNQDDLPWWGLHILNWIGMVKSISEMPGERAPAFRDKLQFLLERGTPGDIRDLYESASDYAKQVARGNLK